MKITSASAAAALALVALTACTGSDDAPGTASDSAMPSNSTPTVTTVSLEVGHCWIEYLRLGDETWAVTRSDQFGGGDSESMRPVPFKGVGQINRIDDGHLEYEDRRGATLTLVPLGHPKAFKIEGKGCA